MQADIIYIKGEGKLQTTDFVVFFWLLAELRRVILGNGYNNMTGGGWQLQLTNELAGAVSQCHLPDRKKSKRHRGAQRRNALTGTAEDKDSNTHTHTSLKGPSQPPTVELTLHNPIPCKHPNIEKTYQSNFTCHSFSSFESTVFWHKIARK